MDKFLGFISRSKVILKAYAIAIIMLLGTVLLFVNTVATS